jgi:hypothetical protein
MTASSRTPEGDTNRCPICGTVLQVEPSRPPGDAPCPSCGSLLWFSSSIARSSWRPARAAKGHKPNGQLLKAAGTGDPIPLCRRSLTMGRRASCDICLPFPNVSGHHCELAFTDGWWILRDRNSTNGIKVNGVRVTETVLHPGDTISIAKRKYIIEYAAPLGPEDLP